MAKIGETDPRWIVAERTDGTNVNNWHWTEKNMMGWANKTLTPLFEDLVLYEASDVELRIVKVDSIKGEANINTRKGKVFHFYELEIKFNFEGEQDGEKVEGTIYIPEWSDEYTPEEVDIEIKVSKGKSKDKIRDIVKKQGLVPVRKKLQEWLTEFKAHKGELKESKQKPLTPEEQRAKELLALEKMDVDEPKRAEKPTTATTTTSTSNKATETVDFTLQFNASPRDIWETLVDVRKVQAYSQSAATIDAREGGGFSTFGDSVTGEFVRLVADEEIVQKWRFSNWPKDHHSKVTLTFKNPGDKLELHVRQTEVPAGESARVQNHWRENVFGRIRVMFGYGTIGFL